MAVNKDNQMALMMMIFADFYSLSFCWILDSVHKGILYFLFSILISSIHVMLILILGGKE